MCDIRIYRVITVIDTNSDIPPSASTYCSPSTVFLLSDEGLDDPSCDFVMLKICVLYEIKQYSIIHIVEFEYEGGKYTGKIEEDYGNNGIFSAINHAISKTTRWSKRPASVSATIRDISSL